MKLFEISVLARDEDKGTPYALQDRCTLRAQDTAGAARQYAALFARPEEGDDRAPRDSAGPPRSYRITIEPLTGPAGQPTGRKECDAEGADVSSALRALSCDLAGMDESARLRLPEGFRPL